ncbi:MAG: anti-sigma F factor [Ruminococcaceae bacterium]|nr:anti-sigma F factor [Oscillospiraceae bacterium]
MKKINELKMIFDSRSVNESFSRMAVSAFSSQLDMTVEELGDIKTVVSEAVTNCIVHAYKNTIGKIYITCSVFEEGVVRITVRDRGCGIEDVNKAREPLYTSVGGDRSGLGFSVMESFSDKLRVRSKVGVGTTVTIEKRICGKTK